MKKKSSKRCLFALFSVLILFGTWSSIKSAEAQRVDDVVPVVALLMTAKEGTIPDEQNKIGTGFFVVDTTANKLFLVTARHLVSTLTLNSLAVIRVKDDFPQEIPLTQLVGMNSPLAWRVHPTADIAVLTLNPAKDILPLLHTLARETLLK